MYSEKEKSGLTEVPNEKFETDSQKLMKLHLGDKNHVISDDDIKNLRVGIQPKSGDKAVEQDQEETKYILSDLQR